MEERLLKIEEIADRLNVTTETINNYRRRRINPIPFFKLGGAIRFRWSEVEEWLERQRVRKGA